MGESFVLEALEKACYEPHGLDLSSVAAAAASRRTTAPNRDRRRGRPLSIPRRPLLDVIEHLDRYPYALASCCRTLAPGGKLVVIALNDGSLARPLLGRRWSFHLDPTRVHMFSASRLRRALADAGLVREVLTTISNSAAAARAIASLSPSAASAASSRPRGTAAPRRRGSN